MFAIFRHQNLLKIWHFSIRKKVLRLRIIESMANFLLNYWLLRFFPNTHRSHLYCSINTPSNLGNSRLWRKSQESPTDANVRNFFERFSIPFLLGSACKRRNNGTVSDRWEGDICRREKNLVWGERGGEEKEVVGNQYLSIRAPHANILFLFGRPQGILYTSKQREIYRHAHLLPFPKNKQAH